MTQKGFIIAESMIPHRRRMRLIERIKNPDQHGLQAETTVRDVWPMYEDGAVSSIICIELIAQSVSAFSTWLRGSGASPRVGFLVGIKTAEFNSATLPIDIDLTVTVAKISKVGNYGVFKGEVSSGSSSFCQAVLQVIEPDKNTLQRFKEQTPGFRGYGYGVIGE